MNVPHDVVKELRQETDHLFHISAPTQDDVETRKAARRRLSRVDSEDANKLQERLHSLYEKWMADHEQMLRNELRILSTRLWGGEELTPEERSRLGDLSDMFFPH